MIFPPSAFVILFLDKMVNTILFCESFAGRRLLKQQLDKTVFNRFIKNLYQIIVAPNADLNNRNICFSARSALKSSFG